MQAGSFENLNVYDDSRSGLSVTHHKCIHISGLCYTLTRILINVTHWRVLQSLSDPNNYHEFCRLLARLKSNYQLGELVKVENYPEVIRLIANFTVTSLQVRGARA